VSESRREPLNSLPPDFVIVLTTPPVKRPNSAEMPPVRTVVSLIASSMYSGFGCPRRFSFTITPSTRKRLSYEFAPEIVIWLFGPASLTPAERRVMSSMVRPVGSWLVCSVRKFFASSVASMAQDARLYAPVTEP